jgi:oxygen-independent coproporphyrinogen-3 oxidase
MGIERISMGVQVTQPDLLKALGRDSNGLEHHYRATEHIRAAGFRKFNLDLMYGFADQSADSWRATLEHAIRLDPDYITLYRMRYKLTRISHQADRVTLDMAREHAKIAKEMLFAAGYAANPGKNTYSRINGDTGTSAYLTRPCHRRPTLPRPRPRRADLFAVDDCLQLGRSGQESFALSQRYRQRYFADSRSL